MMLPILMLFCLKSVFLNIQIKLFTWHMPLECAYLTKVNHQPIINYHSTSPILLDKGEY